MTIKNHCIELVAKLIYIYIYIYVYIYIHICIYIIIINHKPSISHLSTYRSIHPSIYGYVELHAAINFLQPRFCHCGPLLAQSADIPTLKDAQLRAETPIVVIRRNSWLFENYICNGNGNGYN
jgi:hypothetical protein